MPEVSDYGFSDDLLLPYIDYFENRVVLDYGCGYGNSSNILSNHAKYVYAVDASNIAIESAKEKYKHKEKIEFFHHSSPYIWLDDDTIDAVYSIDVVEHLHPDDFKIHLDEIYRVLTKGGVYVFLTCDGDNGPSDCSSWFYPKGFGFQPKGIHLKEYTFEDLKIELKEFVIYYILSDKNSNFPTSKFYELWESIFYSQNYNMKNFAHKDFEFVNLFFLENYESHLQCGIIDFQSAFMGFIGWDLLSLLENPRIDFTRDYDDKLIEYFYDNTSIIENLNTFREQYYVLSLARQTRLLGRWKKLLIINNDNQYLDYLKITKSRTTATLRHIKNNELRSIYEKYL